MQYIVTDGKTECSILACDATEALEYYTNRRTEAFGVNRNLWISGARNNGAELYVMFSWLDWKIPGLA